jgi:hypothetical protein
MLDELRAIRKRSTASRVGKAQRRGHRRVR